MKQKGKISAFVLSKEEVPKDRPFDIIGVCLESAVGDVIKFNMSPDEALALNEQLTFAVFKFLYSDNYFYSTYIASRNKAYNKIMEEKNGNQDSKKGLKKNMGKKTSNKD